MEQIPFEKLIVTHVVKKTFLH